MTNPAENAAQPPPAYTADAVAARKQAARDRELLRWVDQQRTAVQSATRALGAAWPPPAHAAAHAAITAAVDAYGEYLDAARDEITGGVLAPAITARRATAQPGSTYDLIRGYYAAHPGAAAGKDAIVDWWKRSGAPWDSDAVNRPAAISSAQAHMAETGELTRGERGVYRMSESWAGAPGGT